MIEHFKNFHEKAFMFFDKLKKGLMYGETYNVSFCMYTNIKLISFKRKCLSPAADLLMSIINVLEFLGDDTCTKEKQEILLIKKHFLKNNIMN